MRPIIECIDQRGTVDLETKLFFSVFLNSPNIETL